MTSFKLEKPIAEYGYDEIPRNIRKSKEYNLLWEKIAGKFNQSSGTNEQRFAMMTREELAIMRNDAIHVIVVDAETGEILSD